jgi:hypothetical protein
MGFVTEHYDVIIVGRGADGGTLVRPLAAGGVPPEPDDRVTAGGDGRQAGTCRFGAGPAVSVLEENGKAWMS